MLRKAVGLGLAGASFYLTQDAICDVLIYARCKAMVEERARDHQRFLSAVGASTLDDCTLGPWYDASTAVGFGGMAATVVMPCRGPRHGSDITVRVRRNELMWQRAELTRFGVVILQVLRKGGFRWPLLFTLTGGEWEPVMMDAKIGMGAGGALASISLLEAEVPAIDGGGGGAAVAGHGGHASAKAVVSGGSGSREAAAAGVSGGKG